VSHMIRTEGLIKRYGSVVALDGLDLVVPKGTILGLLGPNGAGKTTAVRILCTLLEPDEGVVEVAGIDVRKDPDAVRDKIGLSGQNAAVDEHLTGYENLDMVGRLYHLGKQKAKDRARELLQEFDLVEAGDRPAKTYSGGMRRRLDLAAALVAKPDVIFLDEPTTGLDPRSRAMMWETIQELVRGGATVLLTTQYMEEADRLCDDIVVIDRGQVIAHGTSDELKTQLGGQRIEAVLANASDLPPAQAILASLAVGDVLVDEQTRALTAAVTGGSADLTKVLQKLTKANISVVDIGLRRPTLDDVFLTLTGHAAEEVAEEEEDAATDTKSKKKSREKEAVR
jgi:ABC-2 type transport system ATP-binding protein